MSVFIRKLNYKIVTKNINHYTNRETCERLCGYVRISVFPAKTNLNIFFAMTDFIPE